MGNDGNYNKYYCVSFEATVIILYCLLYCYIMCFAAAIPMPCGYECVSKQHTFHPLHKVKDSS